MEISFACVSTTYIHTTYQQCSWEPCVVLWSLGMITSNCGSWVQDIRGCNMCFIIMYATHNPLSWKWRLPNCFLIFLRDAKGLYGNTAVLNTMYQNYFFIILTVLIYSSNPSWWGLSAAVETTVSTAILWAFSIWMQMSVHWHIKQINSVLYILRLFHSTP